MLTLLVAWTLMYFGLTYLITAAEITEPVRIRLVAWKPVLALLLACRSCTSFWTGQAAAAAVMGLAVGLGTNLPWHSWLYLPPVAGVAAVGLIDLIAFGKRRSCTDG